MASTTNNNWQTPDDTDLVKDGALSIRTLGNDIDTSVGKGLLAWQSWAPTLSGGWTNGTGTWDAKYCQIGKTILVSGKFTIGNGNTNAGLTCSLPVTARTNVMSGSKVRIVTATTYYGFTYLNSTTTFQIYVDRVDATYATAAAVGGGVPAAFSAGHILDFQFTYEAA